VSGIGSTAFAKLLGQQSPSARISVALGRLPWGYAATAGGPAALAAWEAMVWGDKTYCAFVLATPMGTSWVGLAGFIKAVFRWNAPPTQSMDISGIEASAASDPTLSTSIYTYTGMMNAGSEWRGGKITDRNDLAGLVAFVTATTNNESVNVDFASWIKKTDDKALVLGNVQKSPLPTYAESVYSALDNRDGTVAIMIDDAARAAASMPAGLVRSVTHLDAAYQAYLGGQPKPVPRRCGGALYLNYKYGEPVPPGKCDDGLVWTTTCLANSRTWSTVSGTTAPMNGYMQLHGGANAFQKGSSCAALKPVLSETYVHMWEKSYD
jgi:hypothetical protein